MSYNKNTWQTGDVITAEKLNNMENGIENTMQTNMMYLKFTEESGNDGETTYTLYDASITPEEYIHMDELPLALVSIGEVIEPELEEDEPVFIAYNKFLTSLSYNAAQTFVTGYAGDSPSAINLYKISSVDNTWTLTYERVVLVSPLV